MGSCPIFTSIKIYHLVFNTFCPFLLCVVFTLPCRKFRGAFLGTSYISKPRLGVRESGYVSCSLDSGLCPNDSQTRINLNLNVELYFRCCPFELGVIGVSTIVQFHSRKEGLLEGKCNRNRHRQRNKRTKRRVRTSTSASCPPLLSPSVPWLYSLSPYQRRTAFGDQEIGSSQIQLSRR